jgi:hypothetical protein
MKVHSWILEVLRFVRGRVASSEEIFLVFVVCVFFIHLWSITVLLIEIPALILRANIWEVIGVIAYVLAFALFESVSVLALLILVGMILPQSLFKNMFVPQGMMVVMLLTAWAISIQPQGLIIRRWNVAPIIVMMAIFYTLVYRFEALKGLLFRTAKAMSVLALTYVGFDVFGVLIVVLRNVL